MSRRAGNGPPQFDPRACSGVARSPKFRPAAQMRPEDGVACVALELGKMVVEGGDGLMFCPAHPHILPQFPPNRDLLERPQRHFIARDTSHPGQYLQADPDANLRTLDQSVAERYRGRTGPFVDWDWLAAPPSAAQTRFPRHVRLDDPVVVRIDGRTRRGAIFKPNRDSHRPG